MIRIGLYSEDRALRLLLSSALGQEFQVLSELSESETDNLISPEECDVVILDLKSGQDSLEERIEYSRRVIASQMPSVLMVEDDLRSIAADLVELGASGYCRRPPSIRSLETLLRRAYETSKFQASPENATSRRQHTHGHQRTEASNHCDQMVGSSSQMQQVYRLVRCVANLNTSVLITGESGTGKELIARAIHNLGARSTHPFVAVSGGAIPETLLEAELFGHEKGAFTGTVGARQGYFEQAGSGTLFLDEIGDLSLHAQVKLLRVLQEREFSRLGSNRLIPLRARMIFATHKDLDEMVAQGEFREDLYYRINVVRITTPPLREHPEDIAQIATHFLKHYSQIYRKPIDGIDPEALALLQSHTWPGNVRELENVIQRALILAGADSICAEDLPLDITEEMGINIQGENVVCIGDHNQSGSFEQQLRDYKIRLAANALRENHGNKTLAARSLRISRAYLHRLIRLGEADHLLEFE